MRVFSYFLTVYIQYSIPFTSFYLALKILLILLAKVTRSLLILFEWLSENSVGICNRQEKRNSSERPGELARFSDTSSSIRIIGPWFPFLLGGIIRKRITIRAKEEPKSGGSGVAAPSRYMHLFNTGRAILLGRKSATRNGWANFLFRNASGHALSEYPFIMHIHTYICGTYAKASHQRESMNMRA